MTPEDIRIALEGLRAGAREALALACRYLGERDQALAALDRRQRAVRELARQRRELQRAAIASRALLQALARCDEEPGTWVAQRSAMTALQGALAAVERRELLIIRAVCR